MSAAVILVAALLSSPATPAAAADAASTGARRGGAAPIQVSGRVAGTPDALAGTTVELVLRPGGPPAPAPASSQPPPPPPATPAISARPRADGGFVLAAPEAGLYRLRLQAPGFAALEIPLLPLVEDVELPPVELTRRGARPRRAAESALAWVPARQAPDPRASLGEPAASGAAAVAVTGRVLDAASRQPLAGALVWCMACRAAPWTRSGGDGAFRLLLERDGPSALSAAAAGHVTGSAWRIEPGRPVAFELPPAAALAGVVVDGAGRPVPGVTVRAEPRGDDSWRDMSDHHPAAVSGAGGRFRLSGLAARRLYEVVARHEAHAPARLLVRAPEPGGKAPPLRLVLSPGRSVVGRVIDPEGAPVAGAAVTVHRSRRSLDGDGRVTEGGGGSAASDAAGRFRLPHLAAGDYELLVARQGFAEPPRLEFAVPEGVGEVDLGDLALERGVALEGRVVASKGAPIEGASVQVQPRMGDFGFESSWRSDQEAQTDADGRFRIADLRRGARVELAVSHPDYGSAEVAEVEVPPAEPLLIELRPLGGLEVRVVDADGTPLPGASVGSYSEHRVSLGGSQSGGTASFARYGETDGEGRLLVRFGAGPVNLLVGKPGYEERRLPAVEVPGGRTAQLEVVLRPAASATLVGRVADDRGRPLPGFQVQAERVVADGGDGWPGAMSWREPATTDAEGSYRVDGLAAGEYAVRAQGPGQRSAEGRVALSTGTRRLDLVVASGTQVSGRVLDGAGLPVARATAQLAGDGGPGRWATTAGDGSFLLEAVPDGSYRLTARAAGFAEEEALPVEVAGAPVTGLEVRLRRAAGRVTGRLLGLEPEEIAAARVHAAAAESRRGVPGEVSADGSYRIEGLAAGEWQVYAGSERGAVASGTVVLGDGESEAVLDLEFASGAAIAGRVLLDGRPLAGVQVTLSGPQQAWTRTDLHGGFRLRRLPPGTYSLVFLGERQAIGWGRAVELGEEDVELEIAIESGSLSGQVLDGASGSPVEGAVVTLEGSHPELDLSFSGPSRRTDAGGFFDFPLLAPGGYVVRVAAEGRDTLETRVEIPEGGGLQIELPLGVVPD